MENRYLAEKNAADTNATIIAQVQSVKDLLCQQEAARKDARIWQLELNQAMCGVVRYPLQTTYSTDCNPFFGAVMGMATAVEGAAETATSNHWSL